MSITYKFASSSTRPDSPGNNPGFAEFKISTHDIKEISANGNGTKPPVTPTGLQRLILSQAALHRAKAVENLAKLKTTLKKDGNLIQGFILHSEGIGSVGYAIFYPMISGQGEPMAYCEDFFVVESFRGHGVAKILFHELAKRTLSTGATKLQWATDKRNIPVHRYVERRLGAHHPDIITISATELLNPGSLPSMSMLSTWNRKELDTRPLTVKDLPAIIQFGLNPGMITDKRGLPFRGFITTLKDAPKAVVAITPGWTHFSTFRLQKGIHLESITVADRYKNSIPLDGIISSIASAAQRYAEIEGRAHFRWHIRDVDGPMKNTLMGRLGLKVDNMVGDKASDLIVYNLENGNLIKLADDSPDLTLRIRRDHPVGTNSRPQEITLR